MGWLVENGQLISERNRQSFPNRERDLCVLVDTHYFTIN